MAKAPIAEHAVRLHAEAVSRLVGTGIHGDHIATLGVGSSLVEVARGGGGGLVACVGRG